MSEQRISEIEHLIATGDLSAAQVFTQMKQLIEPARAQGDAEPVGVIELSDYVQLDDYAPVPRKKALTETSKGSIQNLPVGTRLYTQPPSGVPAGLVNLSESLARDVIHLADCSDAEDRWTVEDRAGNTAASIQELLSTNATPPRPEWVKCEDRFPTEADEDERHELWTCLEDVNGEMHIARNNAAFVESFAQQTDLNKLWWTPTGLKRPNPPEQGGE